MKTVALTEYLQELDPDEIADMYEECPGKILNAFNCSPGQLQSLIEREFPEAVEDLEEEADDDADRDDEDTKAETEEAEDEDESDEDDDEEEEEEDERPKRRRRS